MTSRASTLLTLALAAVIAAGCGSSSNNKTTTSSSATGAGNPTNTAPASTPASSGAGAATTKLTNEADESGGLYFKKKQLKAKAGQVTITVENPKTSGKPHGIAVEGNGVDKDGKIVQPGGKSTVTLKLKPGKYSFYCPVPGHKQAGMTGTLVVQ